MEVLWPCSRRWLHSDSNPSSPSANRLGHKLSYDSKAQTDPVGFRHHVFSNQKRYGKSWLDGKSRARVAGVARLGGPHAFIMPWGSFGAPEEDVRQPFGHRGDKRDEGHVAMGRGEENLWNRYIIFWSF